MLIMPQIGISVGIVNRISIDIRIRIDIDFDTILDNNIDIWTTMTMPLI